MKRLMVLFVGVLLAAAPAFAQAKAGKAAKSDAAGKTMSAMGSVTAVSGDSLTVKAKTGDMTFAVDSSTHVSAPGASHKSAAAKDAKKPTVITDFVKVGDDVSVKYHDMGATKHAASVMVRSATPAAASKSKKK
jgi:hypothetical protein